MTEIKPYGSWESPISPDLLAGAVVGLRDVATDGDHTCWLESRPTEGGRNVVVRRSPDGATHDATPAPFDARTRVHEYGGGDFVADGGKVFFANFWDQRLYSVGLGIRYQTLIGPVRLEYGKNINPRPGDPSGTLHFSIGYSF